MVTPTSPLFWAAAGRGASAATRATATAATRPARGGTTVGAVDLVFVMRILLCLRNARPRRESVQPISPLEPAASPRPRSPPNTRRPYSGALRRLYAWLGRPRGPGRSTRWRSRRVTRGGSRGPRRCHLPPEGNGRRERQDAAVRRRVRGHARGEPGPDASPRQRRRCRGQVARTASGSAAPARRRARVGAPRRAPGAELRAAPRPRPLRRGAAPA